MDPNWVAVGLTAIGMIGTGIVAYHASLRGTAVALARFEADQKNDRKELERHREELDAHAELLNDYGPRIAVIEKVIDMRPPPLDYQVR